jgi:hypothetical protein
MLANGQPLGEVQLTPEEHVIVTRSRQRTQERIAARLRPAIRTLTSIRTEQRLSTGRLAQLINLPTEVLLRIERGMVSISTIPDLLINRLALALGMPETGMRPMLALQRASDGTRLSARDGTTRTEEVPISFAEALARSRATPEQQAEWLTDSHD